MFSYSTFSKYLFNRGVPSVNKINPISIFLSILSFLYNQPRLGISHFLFVLGFTPVYNFINGRLAGKPVVLKPLSQQLILYVFRYF